MPCKPADCASSYLSTWCGVCSSAHFGNGNLVVQLHPHNNMTLAVQPTRQSLLQAVGHSESAIHPDTCVLPGCITGWQHTPPTRMTTQLQVATTRTATMCITPHQQHAERLSHAAGVGPAAPGSKPPWCSGASKHAGRSATCIIKLLSSLRMQGAHLRCAVKRVFHCIAQLHQPIQQLLPEGCIPHDGLRCVVRAAGYQRGHRHTVGGYACETQGVRGTGSAQAHCVSWSKAQACCTSQSAGSVQRQLYGSCMAPRVHLQGHPPPSWLPAPVEP